ncbi:MBL fold metallo-hydrolase [Pontibacter sp. 13R65]|uniref:MBL fold metallo-hydrolase n=1 Tax=Pontibacter sp. 13R65 TaxID=3127458 RepID=UPI00301B78B4
MIGIIIGSLFGAILLGGAIFMNVSPQFGGKPTKEKEAAYEQLSYYQDGKFQNLIPTSMDMKFGDMLSTMGDMIKGDPNRQPGHLLPVQTIDSLDIANRPEGVERLTWFGHSAFLLEIGGKNILLDPMLGESPSPLPMFGSKRYAEKLPIEVAKLPHIDAVIISHDHYDHLDYSSIQQLKDKVDALYTPLGVGAHLAAWGVDEAKIHELKWGDEVTHKGLTFICTPARHFSGRGLFDRFSTLWASWVIKSGQKSLYFSGDSGYGPHFKEIGDKYGPFDVAMMECGQYNERWGNIHMFPEQTVQAFQDVQGKLLLPIHWGAFSLALHTWTDPIERVSAKAKELNVHMATPRIGESIDLNQTASYTKRWWEQN